MKPRDCKPGVSRGDWTFPGKLAGASLKPDGPNGPPTSAKAFPGKLAGASLKLHGAAVGEAVELDLSPANLPGPH